MDYWTKIDTSCPIDQAYSEKNDIQIRIAGRGGQGIRKLGLVLAEACTLEGKTVVQTQNYTPEVRGGSSKADIILSHKEEVDYPLIKKIDIFLSLGQQDRSKNFSMLANHAIVIYDSGLVEPPNSNCRHIGFPFEITAKKEFSDKIFANMILLGTFVAVTGIVRSETVVSVIKKRIKKYKGKNLNAFSRGIEIGNAKLHKTLTFPAN